MNILILFSKYDHDKNNNEKMHIYNDDDDVLLMTGDLVGGRL